MYTRLYIFRKSHKISFTSVENKMSEDNKNVIKCYFFKRGNSENDRAL